MSPQEPPDLTGKMIGEYYVVARIGSGGMGAVYEGRHPLIGKRVAVKVLLPHLAKQKVPVDRFLDEARAVNEIRHRGIVDIFGFGQMPSGLYYFVMEYLDGQSFDALIEKSSPLPLRDVLHYMVEILDALEAAHQAGVIHRDLKPSNIFLVDSGREKPYVKLLDFGVAKLGVSEGEATPQTRQSVVVGTPEYISPEQARGQPVSTRTDLYALGVVMFELLTGRRPFVAENPLQTMWMHVEAAVPRASDYRDDIPHEIDELIMWMMKKELNERPESTAVLRTHMLAIKSLFVTDPVASLLPPPPQIMPMATGKPSLKSLPAVPSVKSLPAVKGPSLKSLPAVPAVPAAAAAPPTPAVTPVAPVALGDDPPPATTPHAPRQSDEDPPTQPPQVPKRQRLLTESGLPEPEYLEDNPASGPRRGLGTAPGAESGPRGPVELGPVQDPNDEQVTTGLNEMDWSIEQGRPHAPAQAGVSRVVVGALAAVVVVLLVVVGVLASRLAAQPPEKVATPEKAVEPAKAIEPVKLPEPPKVAEPVKAAEAPPRAEVVVDAGAKAAPLAEPLKSAPTSEEAKKKALARAIKKATEGKVAKSIEDAPPLEPAKTEAEAAPVEPVKAEAPRPEPKPEPAKADPKPEPARAEPKPEPAPTEPAPGSAAP